MLPVRLLAIITAATCVSIPQKPLHSPDDGTPLPLIIWHGLGDQYNNPGIQDVADLASSINPGTFVYPIRLSEDGSADKRATFVGNINEQIDQVCSDLASHPILSTAPAVNALGFSQGGQFLRAYVERCNNPPVATLVTFGSQHNGIAEFQACEATNWLCRGWQGILKSQTWTNYVQTTLVPAQYFRNPEDLENYMEFSGFLADVNNERVVKNQTYRENLIRLEKLVLFIFEEDETVVPKWSGWFDEFNATSGKRVELRERDLYREDWLGLRWLDERGRLVFESTKGGHMNLGDKLLKDVFRKYFSKTVDVDKELALDL